MTGIFFFQLEFWTASWSLKSQNKTGPILCWFHWQDWLWCFLTVIPLTDHCVKSFMAQEIGYLWLLKRAVIPLPGLVTTAAVFQMWSMMRHSTLSFFFFVGMINHAPLVAIISKIDCMKGRIWDLSRLESPLPVRLMPNAVVAKRFGHITVIVIKEIYDWFLAKCRTLQMSEVSKNVHHGKWCPQWPNFQLKVKKYEGEVK